jgi:ribose 5-phosphate isomerase B
MLRYPQSRGNTGAPYYMLWCGATAKAARSDNKMHRVSFSLGQVVAIANDHAGVALKTLLLEEINACGFTPLDLGTNQSESVDYPDYGNLVAEAVLHDRAQFGIAICGSGIGISIACNRHKHIRAALCHTGLEAQLARQHNSANILCLGARLIGEAQARECVRRFLTTGFEGGRHIARVEKLG